MIAREEDHIWLKNKEVVRKILKKEYIDKPSNTKRKTTEENYAKQLRNYFPTNASSVLELYSLD